MDTKEYYRFNKIISLWNTESIPAYKIMFYLAEQLDVEQLKEVYDVLYDIYVRIKC